MAWLAFPLCSHNAIRFFRVQAFGGKTPRPPTTFTSDTKKAAWENRARGLLKGQLGSWAWRRARNGLSMVKASGRIPASTRAQVIGAAIGNPGRTRGE